MPLPRTPSIARWDSLEKIPIPPQVHIPNSEDPFLVQGTTQWGTPLCLEWGHTGQLLGNGHLTSHTSASLSFLTIWSSFSIQPRIYFSSVSGWQGFKYFEILSRECSLPLQADPIMQMRQVRNGSHGQTSSKGEIWAMGKSLHRRTCPSFSR